MLNDDDDTLLRAWTGSRSEEAFRRLVDRYAGLVFGAAKRRTGDDQLAAEAAQDTFVSLAQRAGGIRRAESLPAWLHAVALRAASDRLRKETRHRERMKRFLSQPETEAGDNGGQSESWKAALPHLDEAIGRLNEIERGIVLARYCQGESVAQAAEKFGISPAAAQKRSERALEKLALLLRRRGVAPGAALLACGLTAEMTRAAPAGLSGKWLAAAIAKNAGHAGAASGWLIPMSAKIASIAAAVLAAAVPVMLKLSANTRARTGAVETERRENRSRFTPPAAQSHGIRGVESAGRLAVNGVDLTALAREIRKFPPREGRLQRELELRAAVLTLDSKQCGVVAGWLADAPAADALSDVAFDLFCHWEGSDREGALEAAAGMKGTPLSPLAESAVLHAWSETDAQGMLAHFSPDLGKDGIGRLALDACRQALRSWARHDPRKALDAAQGIGGQQGPGLMDAVFMGWADGESPDAPLTWLASEATPAQQTLHYKPLIGYLQDNYPDKAWNSLVTWPNRAVAEDEACATLNLWAGNDPEAAVSAWLAGPEQWRNKHFAFNLSQVLAYARPELARKLAVELPDPKLRETFAMIVADRLDKPETKRN